MKTGIITFKNGKQKSITNILSYDCIGSDRIPVYLIYCGNSKHFITINNIADLEIIEEEENNEQ